MRIAGHYRPAVVLALLAMGGLATACGHAGTPASSSADAAAEPTLQVEAEPGYGALLTDPSGSPFYVWTAAGAARKRPCGRGCPRAWVPLVVPSGATGAAGVNVRSSLIGTVGAPDGQRQVTYAGWPLYTYLGDKTTFVVHGNDRRVAGGTFRAIRASGTLAPLRP